MKKEKHEALGRFEEYLLARGRKNASRSLQVAQRFLEVNPEEEEEDPFEAHNVNRFLASFGRGDARGRTLRWIYYVVKSFFRALGHSWPFDQDEVPKAEENEDVPTFTSEEMLALEEAAKCWENPETAARNYAIVAR